MTYNPDMKLWVVRFLIGFVFSANVSCAILFLVSPDRYAPSFELEGKPGIVVIRSVGILFLMWNVPYLVALWQPRKNSGFFLLAIVMQAIGVGGEFWIFLGLGIDHPILEGSLKRFLSFDTLGLILLLFAFGLVKIRLIDSPK